LDIEKIKILITTDQLVMVQLKMLLLTLIVTICYPLSILII